MPLHSLASGTDLHEAKREKEPVRVASTANVSLTAPGASIDAVTLAVSDRVLLKNQTAPAENGIYVWTGAATTLARATDADAASDFVFGWKVYVREGTTNGGTHWVFTQSNPVTLGTTGITIVGLGTGSGPAGPTGAQGIPGTPGSILVTISGATPYICMQDQKPQNTSGGTFTSGADQTRVLNTIVANDLNLATLVANQITLPAGTYRCHISAPAVTVSRHQAWLHNVTDNAVMLRGSSSVASTAQSVDTRSVISARFAIQSPKTFEVRHRCETTAATRGFGFEANFGTEIYTIAEFWLEAGPPPFFGRTPENPNLDKTLAKQLDAMTSVMMIGQQSNCLLPV